MGPTVFRNGKFRFYFNSGRQGQWSKGITVALGFVLLLILAASCAGEGTYRLHLIFADDAAKESVKQVELFAIERGTNTCGDWQQGELVLGVQNIYSRLVVELPPEGEHRLSRVPARALLFLAEGRDGHGPNSAPLLRGCTAANVRPGAMVEVTIRLDQFCTPLDGGEVIGNGKDDDCDGLTDECGADGDCDDNNVCTLDLCENGVCHQSRYPDRLPCQDMDRCTRKDACAEGVCRGEPKDCRVYSGQCRLGGCEEPTGACAAQPVADGLPCGDGLFCSEEDACRGGSCVGHARVCDDGDACTLDECNERENRCEHIRAARPGLEGAAGNPTCANRVDDDCDGLTDLDDPNCRSCVQDAECEDGNACTVDRCGEESCVNEALADGAICDDGRYCTVADKCQGGACRGAQRDCSGVADSCGVALCAEAEGRCTTEARPDGTFCDDRLYCTVADKCQGGVCVGTMYDCDDDDRCTSERCDEANDRCERTFTAFPEAEGPAQEGSCTNLVDDDCDGMTDGDDPGCGRPRCTYSGECLAPEKPRCAGGDCVGCETPADCEHIGGLPKCGPDGRCVACLESADCPPGAGCDPLTQTCEAGRAHYFVAPAGKDTNDGSSAATAWRTITFAATKAKAGDTVNIEGGNYGHEHVEMNNSGTVDRPIVFRGYHGTPLIDGEDETGDGFNLEGTETTPVRFVVLENLSATRYADGFCVDYADTVTLQNLSSTTMGGAAFYLWYWNNSVLKACNATDARANIWLRHSHFNLVDGCTSLAIRTDITTGAHIKIEYGHDNVIQNCTAENRHSNIDVEGGFGIGIGDRYDSVRGYYDAHSTNNRIIDCVTRGMATSFFVTHYGHDNEFRNCMAYRDGLATEWVLGLMVRDGANRNVFKNCRVQGYLYGIDLDETVETPEVAPPRDNVFSNCIVKDSVGHAIRLVNAENNTFNNCVFARAGGLFRLMQQSGNSLVNSVVTDVGEWSWSSDAVDPAVTFSCFWNNGFPTPSGTGNLQQDPLFADPAGGDFHEKSQYGRWSGSDWIHDDVTSPCIDAGDPASDFSQEPAPNGGRVNIGGFGNTTAASKSPGTTR